MHLTQIYRKSGKAVFGALIGLAALGLVAPVMAQTSGQGRSTTDDAQADRELSKPASAPTTVTKKGRNGKMTTTTAPPLKGARKISKKTMVAMPAARVVLVLPPDIKDTNNPELTEVISSVVQSRLSSSGTYHVVNFSRTLPSVRRARNEQTLSDLDVKPPFDSDAKARKLAGVAGYDMVMEIFINSYTYDADKNEANIIMTGRLLDLSGRRTVPRNATEQGTLSGPMGGNNESSLAVDLARDLAEKIMTQVLRAPSTAPTTTSTHSGATQIASAK